MNHVVGLEMIVACRGEQWYVLKPDGHEVPCASARAANEKAEFLQEAARLYDLWVARNVPLNTMAAIIDAAKNALDLGVKLVSVDATPIGSMEVHFEMPGCCGYIETNFDKWEMYLLGYTTFVGRATTENELRDLFEKAPLMYNKVCHAAREKRDPRGLYLPLTWT